MWSLFTVLVLQENKTGSKTVFSQTSNKFSKTTTPDTPVSSIFQTFSLKISQKLSLHQL